MLKNLAAYIRVTKKRLFLLLYFVFYLTAFYLIEHRRVEPHYFVIHSPLDDKIPFCEFFVIPYFVWFGYMAFAFLFTWFEKDGHDYYRLCVNLFTGMTVFVIVSCVFPNCDHLRPDVFPRENIFTDLVKMLYRIDTPTNIFPSIHVFNTIGIHFAVLKSDRYKNKTKQKTISLLVAIAIILATMFLKQHSTIDVLGGTVMAFLFYPFVYGRWSRWINPVFEKYDAHIVLK